MSESQAHPLYASDRDVVDRLLAAEHPTDVDLVDAARLLMRYQGFPGADDLQEDLAKVIRLWDLDPDALHERTRAIWAAGFRPNRGLEDPVGSSFDAVDQES